MSKNSLALGLDQTVVSAITQLFIAGQRAADGHMPHMLTANGLRVGIAPGTNVVSLSFRELNCTLSPLEAYELATMMSSAADALREIGQNDVSIVGHNAVATSLSRLKAVEAPLARTMPAEAVGQTSEAPSSRP